MAATLRPTPAGRSGVCAVFCFFVKVRRGHREAGSETAGPVASGRIFAMERRAVGRSPGGHQQSAGVAHPAAPRYLPATAPELVHQHGPRVRPQSRRCGGPLPEPAGECARARRRRETLDSGSGAGAGLFAPARWEGRERVQPLLHTARHNNPFRGTRSHHRTGQDGPLSTSTQSEFLAFMNEIVSAHPGREIHVVLDNLNTHKPKEDRWLKRHSQVHFHFIPTYSSWLNQVECWFSILSRQALRGASFTSPHQLRQAIDGFVAVYNQKAAPFEWKKAVVFSSGPARKYSNLRN